MVIGRTTQNRAMMPRTHHAPPTACGLAPGTTRRCDSILAMTTLQIPNNVLQQAGIAEREAVVELACRLFETGRLSIFFAAQLAGLAQPDFEDMLRERNIPMYRYTEDDLQNDLRTLRQSGEQTFHRQSRDMHRPSRSILATAPAMARRRSHERVPK